MSATSAQGTQLKVTISATPTLIPQVVGFTGPAITPEFEDVTTLDSAGSYKEYVSTLLDVGEVSFDIIYNRSNTVHQYLRTAQVGRTLETFTIDWPGSMPGTTVFTAYVSNWQYKVEKGTSIKVSVTLRVSGEITETYV